jgi:hypothetical protein
MIMSPLQIRVLLHHYYSSEAWDGNEDVEEIQTNFVAEGLIEDTENVCLFVIKPRGSAYVEALCALPLPVEVTKWVVTKGVVTREAVPDYAQVKLAIKLVEQEYVGQSLDMLWVWAWHVVGEKLKEDRGRGTVVYSKVGEWPEGAEVDADTGAISFTPQEEGSYKLTTRATDKDDKPCGKLLPGSRKPHGNT